MKNIRLGYCIVFCLLMLHQAAFSQRLESCSEKNNENDCFFGEVVANDSRHSGQKRSVSAVYSAEPKISADPLSQRSKSSHDESLSKGQRSSERDIVNPRNNSSILGFDGINNRNTREKPDISADVSRKYYVQAVNASIAVYNKQGGVVAAPKDLNSLWAGFGGVCETKNGGHPAVAYDDMADRWVIIQPAENGDDDRQCVAVSMTGDPTGYYYLYDFPYVDGDGVNDEPKISVGEKAYYTSGTDVHPQFRVAISYAIAYERSQLLNGLPARQITFEMENILSMTPMRVDGKKIPAEDYEQLYVLGVNFQVPLNSEYQDITINKFDVDWSDVSKSSFSAFQKINVTPWKATLRADQPNNTTLFVNYDTAPDFVFNGLKDRNSLLYSHTVASTDSILSPPAVRWYEFNLLGNDIEIRQQADFKPDASGYWLGNVAEDSQGNLALGYSVSSNSVFPSISMASRLVDDPLSSLTATAEIKTGEGAQKGSSDWGRYSNLKLDPADDCTFWLSNQYYKAADNDTNKWSTYIANFKLDQCTALYTSKIMGKVRHSRTFEPVSGALVNIGNTFSYTNENGDYEIDLPAGNYRGQVTAYGFSPFKVADFELVEDEEATLNIELFVANRESLTGRVYDKIDDSRNLYAKLSVTGPGGAGFSLFSHPETGQFELPLVDGIKAQVIPVAIDSPDYFDPDFPTMLTGASGATHSFPLSVKSTCNALGYSNTSGSCQPVNGNFVAGYVVDQYGDRLSGINLKNQAGDLLATSRATPDDIALDDGFLYGFVPASAATGLTLSASTIVTKAVTVSQIKLATPIVVQNLKPMLAPIQSVPVEVIKGQSIQVPITLESTGGLPVTFEFMDTVEWLSFSPDKGSIDPEKTQTVTLTVNSATMTAGATSLATVTVKTNSDPVTFTVSAFVKREDAPVLEPIADVSMFSTIGETTKTKVTLESIGKQTVNFNMETDVSWLSFSPDTGSVGSGQSREVELIVNATSLPLGISTAQVTVKTNGKSISFALSVIVLPTTDIQDVSLSLVKGEVLTTTVPVANGSPIPLDFNVATGVPWLTVSPATGTVGAGQTQIFTLTVDSTNMQLGVSKTKVTVQVGVIPVEFDVSVTVNPSVTPKLAPIDDISLSVVKGDMAQAQIVAKNIGNAEANFTITTSVPWLTFNPAAARIEASESQQVTLTVDSTNMPIGTSVARVIANSGGNTVTFDVSVEVMSAAPTPKVDNISDVSLSVIKGNTVQSSVSLTNIGTATGDFTLTTSVPWLTFNPASTSIDVGERKDVVLTVDSSNLPIGTSNTRVTVSTSNNVVTFNVSVEVTAVPTPKLDNISDVTVPVVRGGTATDSVSLKNIGTASVSFAIDNSAPWLTFTPRTGSIDVGRSLAVDLSIDSSGLALGTHTTQVNVNTNGNLVRFNVTINVTEQTLGALSFSYDELTVRTLEPIPNLVISRTEEMALAASVDYQITVDGAEIFSGRLNWASGEGGNRSINIPPRSTPATIVISFSNPVNVTLPRSSVTIRIEAINIIDSFTTGGSMGVFWVFMLLIIGISRRSFYKCN